MGGGFLTVLAVHGAGAVYVLLWPEPVSGDLRFQPTNTTCPYSATTAGDQPPLTDYLLAAYYPLGYYPTG